VPFSTRYWYGRTAARVAGELDRVALSYDPVRADTDGTRTRLGTRLIGEAGGTRVRDDCESDRREDGGKEQRSTKTH